MKKHTKKLAALLVAFAMVFSVVGTALAADDEVMRVYKNHAPTDVTTSNFQYLSGATAAANTPVLSILGINVTSTDAAGALNAGGDATAPLNLLVFGSELNENPDPYLANFYYNLDVDNYVLPADQYDSTSYGNWKGAYTLLNYAKSGPTGGASNTTVIPIDVNYVSKECNPVFFYEPDVLLGSTISSYNTGLTYYQGTYNADYNPLQVGGWGTGSNQYALNDGTFASTVAMANGVYQEALDVQEYLDVTKSTKTGRYGDIVDCGVVYSSFGLGLYYYAQSMIVPADERTENDGKLTEVAYAYEATYDGKFFTTKASSGRIKQYLDGLGTEIGSDSYLLEDLIDLNVHVLLSTSIDVDEDEDLKMALEEAEIIVVDPTLPDTVYGTSMQAPDNILGPGYMFAVLYSDQLADLKINLTKEDLTAYFVDNIYHVNTGDDVQTVVNTMYGIDEGEGDVPINANYNSIINEMIIEGAYYYLDNCLGSDNWLAVEDNSFWEVF